MKRAGRIVLVLTLACLPAGCPPVRDTVNRSDEGGGGVVSDSVTLSGCLNPAAATKTRPRMQSSTETYPYTIVAQSDETGEVYRTQTDAAGEFELVIPPEEVGHSFVVTILGPDGRAVGPVVVDTDTTGQEGVTGLKMSRAADLGSIDLPEDPGKTPVTPGPDSDTEELADPTIATRLTDGGAPLGVACVGKGAEAGTTATRTTGAVDADRDGLIDLFDADDDGDGVMDDLDKGDDWTGVPRDIHVSFFMNLKVGAEDALTYYAGTGAEIADALGRQTVITFEVMTEPHATRAITRAYLRETPGPAYLPEATLLQGGPSATRWRDTGYAFTRESDRFDAFVVPHTVMNAGDTFTLVVEFDDGSSVELARMINYVFKSIPALVQYGAPGALNLFDITDPAANGRPNAPLRFDASGDLVLVFRPPPDETGAPITGTAYAFGVFFNDADGRQLNNDIDSAATWPTPIPHWAEHQGTSYRLTASDLGPLSAEGTYTVTLPAGIFVEQVTLTDGTTAPVASYKIDIAAEVPTGNAAVMLTFARQ